MFWKRKREALPPQAGCFGKLPATGDFVRLNAGGAELASFDRWLGAGMDYAQRAMGPAFEAAYASAVGLFVVRGDGQADEEPERGLVGAWAASGDSAGRSYPMVVFGSYDYAELVALGAALPVALWPLLEATYELATAGRHLPVDAFLARVASISCPAILDVARARADYRTFIERNRVKAFWESCFEDMAVRARVLDGLCASVEPFRGKELPRTSLALRVPVFAGEAYAAAIWMDAAMRVAGWSHTLPNLFWTPQQTALIHLGPPHASSFRELVSPSRSADHVVDLVDVETSKQAEVLDPRRLALANDESLTVAGFLEALR